MASVTGITAARADEILGQSVVSGSINGDGHLILARQNGETFDAGDFETIIEGLVTDTVDADLAPAVSAAVAGTLFPLGNKTGALAFTAADHDTLVNAMFTLTATGNLTVNVATAFPATPKAGTQFTVRITQDATGGRTLTLTGIKKSMGILELSTDAAAIDIIVFMFDGTYWFAGAMGLAFS